MASAALEAVEAEEPAGATASLPVEKVEDVIHGLGEEVKSWPVAVEMSLVEVARVVVVLVEKTSM